MKKTRLSFRDSLETISTEKLRQRSEKYPEVPESWSRTCTYCGEATVQLEGYANWYNAVYRCPKCRESMVYNDTMEEQHWRYQVDGIDLRDASSGDAEVQYPDA